MSNELDEIARSLFNGQIPSIWQALAPATLKSLGNWMIHFQSRYAQYSKWVSLFNPQASSLMHLYSVAVYSVPCLDVTNEMMP